MIGLLKLAWANVKNAKVRSLLTIIGIFIGITAVVALISLGQGLQENINDQFAQIGADKLFIQTTQDAFGTAGGQITRPLTDRDMDVIRGVRGVDLVGGYNIRTATVDVSQQRQFNFIIGLPVDEAYDMLRESTTLALSEGRELRDGDRGRILVGHDYTRREVIQTPVELGDRITINDERFTIVGIVEPAGNPPDDRSVWMTREDMDRLVGLGDDVEAIVVQVRNEQEILRVAEDIERALLSHRGLREENKDFTVQTPQELLDSFGTILLTVQIVLIGIALISLLVGGIGIMNTMYTAVLERTKEIGVMKAIGATPRQIQSIFLIEAGILGLMGGAVGVLLGLGIAKGIEYAGQAALNTDFVNAWISWELIAGSLVFAMITGMASGYLPARAASKQNAVESLRYE